MTTPTEIPRSTSGLPASQSTLTPSRSRLAMAINNRIIPPGRSSTSTPASPQQPTPTITVTQPPAETSPPTEASSTRSSVDGNPVLLPGFSGGSFPSRRSFSSSVSNVHMLAGSTPSSTSTSSSTSTPTIPPSPTFKQTETPPSSDAPSPVKEMSSTQKKNSAFLKTLMKPKKTPSPSRVAPKFQTLRPGRVTEKKIVDEQTQHEHEFYVKPQPRKVSAKVAALDSYFQDLESKLRTDLAKLKPEGDPSTNPLPPTSTSSTTATTSTSSPLPPLPSPTKTTDPTILPPPPTTSTTGPPPLESGTTTTEEPKTPSKTEEKEVVKPPRPKITGIDPKNEREVMRALIFSELAETEARYVAGLDCMVKVYMKPMQSKTILSFEQIKAIFCITETLLRFHEGFSEKLDKTIVEWSETTRISLLFTEIQPFFAMYFDYVNNYDKALNTLVKAQRDIKKFALFLKETQSSKEASKFGLLADLLITPVQRLPRYRLLLEMILKHTPKDHHDYDALKKAYESISKAIESVNEKQRDAENQLQLLRINNLLEGAYRGLVQPHRKYIFEGQVGVYLVSEIPKKGIGQDKLSILQQGGEPTSPPSVTPTSPTPTSAQFPVEPPSPASPAPNSPLTPSSTSSSLSPTSASSGPQPPEIKMKAKKCILFLFSDLFLIARLKKHLVTGKEYLKLQIAGVLNDVEISNANSWPRQLVALHAGVSQGLLFRISSIDQKFGTSKKIDIVIEGATFEDAGEWVYLIQTAQKKEGDKRSSRQNLIEEQKTKSTQYATLSGPLTLPPPLPSTPPPSTPPPSTPPPSVTTISSPGHHPHPLPNEPDSGNRRYSAPVLPRSLSFSSKSTETNTNHTLSPLASPLSSPATSPLPSPHPSPPTSPMPTQPPPPHFPPPQTPTHTHSTSSVFSGGTHLPSSPSQSASPPPLPTRPPLRVSKPPPFPPPAHLLVNNHNNPSSSSSSTGSSSTGSSSTGNPLTIVN